MTLTLELELIRTTLGERDLTLAANHIFIEWNLLLSTFWSGLSVKYSKALVRCEASKNWVWVKKDVAIKDHKAKKLKFLETLTKILQTLNSVKILY